MSPTRPPSSPPFTVAKIVEAVQHPNADRLRSARSTPSTAARRSSAARPTRAPGLTTIYAPIGAYVPGLGVTLVEKPVRGVVSNGMLCSAAELELAEESDGILELPDDLAVGTPAAEAVRRLEAGHRLRGHPQPPRLAGRRRHRPRPGRRRPRHAEAPCRRAGARRPSPARSRSRSTRRGLPGVRRPADPRRQERPVAGLAAGRG